MCNLSTAALLAGADASIFKPFTTLQLVLNLFVDQGVVHLHVNHGGVLRSPVVRLEFDFLFQNGHEFLVQGIQLCQVSNLLFGSLEFFCGELVGLRRRHASLVKGLEGVDKFLVANGSLGGTEINRTGWGLVLFKSRVGSRDPGTKLVELGSDFWRASPDFTRPKIKIAKIQALAFMLDSFDSMIHTEMSRRQRP
jgi:hypothetical protein